MDENTNQKIEELKKNPPSRFFPMLLIPVAVVGLFCYRVATTDPRWQAAAPQPAATAKPAVKPVSAPSAKPATTVQPQAQPATPAPAPAKVQSETSHTTAAATATADSATETTSVEPQVQSAAAESTPVDEGLRLDAYLAQHLGKQIPFLYNGESRLVILSAFDDDTITIKRRKTFTLKRSELTPEQLALWK